MRMYPPWAELNNLPCAQVAISCALGYIAPMSPSSIDGYTTLADQNRYVRQYLNVAKSVTFKRGERPKLKDLLANETRKAIICVYGHFVYYNGKNYLSYFDNDNDEVVRVWYLR